MKRIMYRVQYHTSVLDSWTPDLYWAKLCYKNFNGKRIDKVVTIETRSRISSKF